MISSGLGEDPVKDENFTARAILYAITGQLPKE